MPLPNIVLFYIHTHPPVSRTDNSRLLAIFLAPNVFGKFVILSHTQ